MGPPGSEIGIFYQSEQEKSIDEYTRVTQILYPFSGLANIPQEIVEKAGKRGTKVHKVCESIMLGFGDLGVNEETSKYIDSFNLWWGEGKEIVAIEKRFFDDSLKITGQADIIFMSEEGLVLADLKTSYKPSKTWPVQGNAYSFLAKSAGYDIKKIQFIHLSKFGKYPKVYEYKIDENLFLSVLTTYNQFYR